MLLRSKILTVFISTIAFGLLYSGVVLAIPVLQVYIEGSTYDISTETWLIWDSDFVLQVIGRTEGLAGETILGVKIAFAVPVGEIGSVSVTALDGDELIPPYPTTPSYGIPILGDGSSLPTHGIYPTDYYEYDIGDFSNTEEVMNMLEPVEPGEGQRGEIKRYQVQWSGYSAVHIDAYNHVYLNEKHAQAQDPKYVNNPFSHDSEAMTPEPGTLLLMGTGLAGLAGYGRLRLKRRRK